MQKSITALITGAGSGIGRAVALEFGRCGHHVFCVGRREDRLLETASLVESIGGSAEALTADISSRAEVVRIFRDTVAVWGRLDVVVNNAGIAHFDPLEEIDEMNTVRQFATNFQAALWCIQTALPLLREAKLAHVVNVTSDQTELPGITNLVYGASKAALEFATRSMAAALAPYGIRVNAVAPGSVDTAMLRSLVDTTRMSTPLGRILRPDDVAKVVLDITRWQMTTGAVIAVDGGTSL